MEYIEQFLRTVQEYVKLIGFFDVFLSVLQGNDNTVCCHVNGRYAILGKIFQYRLSYIVFHNYPLLID